MIPGGSISHPGFKFPSVLPPKVAMEAHVGMPAS